MSQAGELMRTAQNAAPAKSPRLAVAQAAVDAIAVQIAKRSGANPSAAGGGAPRSGDDEAKAGEETSQHQWTYTVHHGWLL